MDIADRRPFELWRGTIVNSARRGHTDRFHVGHNQRVATRNVIGGGRFHTDRCVASQCGVVDGIQNKGRGCCRTSGDHNTGGDCDLIAIAAGALESRKIGPRSHVWSEADFVEKSAFDLVVRQFLICNLYHYGIQDQGFVLIDHRLKNRKTVCEWNGQLMGPILDRWGVVQGNMYKVYNNDQIGAAQDSKFGVQLPGTEAPVISAIGQADDICLVSNDIYYLLCLLQLSLLYCKKYHIELVPEKTSLLCFSPKGMEVSRFYWKLVSPLH